MKRILYGLMMTLTPIIAMAQKKSAEAGININKDSGGSFWNDPWVWIVGADVFIILLLTGTISRRGSRE